MSYVFNMEYDPANINKIYHTTNILFPILPKTTCERCCHEIVDTTPKYMARDRSFCTENCRRIFLTTMTFLQK